MSKAKVFEQIDLFAPSQPQQDPVLTSPQPDKKTAFVPVHSMALDPREVKINFMYMMRIVLNSHQKKIALLENQNQYLQVLIDEMKIKKGLIDPILAVRTAALQTIKKN